MLSGAATSRITAIVGPPSATDTGIIAVNPARPRSARSISLLRSLRSAIAPGDHPEKEIGKRLNGTDDAHRKPRAREREDEQREGREVDGVAERRDALASEDDLEVAIPGQRDGEGLPGHPAMVRKRPLTWRFRCLAFGRWMSSPLPADSILRGGRRLGGRGLISAGEGNLSVRLDEDRLLVTPAGRRKDELEPDDLVVVRLGHTEQAPTSRSGLSPTSDLAIHLAVYAARPDIAAVAHAHLPAAMALTLAGEVPDPSALPETALFLPRLPYLTLGVPGSAELARTDRGGTDRATRAVPRGRAAGTARRGRGRDERGAGGRSARARRSPVPDVARRVADPRCPRRGSGMRLDQAGMGRRHASAHAGRVIGSPR